VLRVASDVSRLAMHNGRDIARLSSEVSVPATRLRRCGVLDPGLVGVHFIDESGVGYAIRAGL
jgi:hypothetical protein